MIVYGLLDYWVRSQRYQALSTPQAREQYVLLSIQPEMAREQDPQRRDLLGRIVQRVAA